MSALIDTVIVGLALLASVAYALWALGPRAWRRAILRTLRLKSAALTPQGACGGCDNCGSESAAARGGAEVKIPVAKIGRR